MAYRGKKKKREMEEVVLWGVQKKSRMDDIIIVDNNYKSCSF
jgi:hypothetical protein